MSQPLVSVVIIFLNAEKFIEEAVTSVFAQTYSHWELLLVDDGSTDESSRLAQRYSDQRPGQVFYLDHDGHLNRGMSVSRNLGIRHARGEYVALLDADDVWLPRKLEQQVSILEAQPELGMVYGLSQYWYSWTGRPADLERDFVRELGFGPTTLVRLPEMFAPYLQGRVTPASPSAVLVRRELMTRVGGFEDRFCGLGEDWAFYAKVLFEAPALLSRECWIRYRQHPDSDLAVTVRTGAAAAAWLTYLDWLGTYLSGLGIRDRDVWRALREEIWRYRHPTLARVRSRGRWARAAAVRTVVRAVPLQARDWLRPRAPRLVSTADRWVSWR